MENLLAILIYGGCCFYWGYRLGVMETEERWSEAVQKAEWAEWDRKHGFESKTRS